MQDNGMTTEKIRQLKRELRAEYKAKRKNVSCDEKSLLDGNICRNILNSVSYKYADVVLMFYPTQYEIDILEVFDKAKKDKKRVAFPRCVSKGIMKFYFAESEDDFEKNSYGINEPKLSCEEYENVCAKHPLCLVPCLCAFTDGKRLGYGGGYYDRFLSHFDGISMCVQYERHLFGEIPFEKRYDKTTDILVTEKAVYVVGKK